MTVSYKPSNGQSGDLISPFLELTSTGIRRLSSAEDAEMLLAFWMSNAEGSILGRPEWGHPFQAKMFMAASELQILEMMAVQKLRKDLPQIRIAGISSEWLETDLLQLTIFYQKNGDLARYTDKVAN